MLPLKSTLELNVTDEASASSGLGKVIDQYLKAYFQDHGDLVPTTGLYALILKEIERPLLTTTLKHVQGNQVKAAQILGIHRNTLRKKIQELGLHTQLT